jgi:hypothetical protein
MDVPPWRMEMFRFDLQGRPTDLRCRPAPGPDATELSFSIREMQLCPRPRSTGVREPSGWPPSGPPPAAPAIPPSPAGP